MSLGMSNPLKLSKKLKKKSTFRYLKWKSHLKQKNAVCPRNVFEIS